MPKPWEKYQQQAEEGGPWEKYAGGGTAVASAQEPTTYEAIYPRSSAIAKGPPVTTKRERQLRANAAWQDVLSLGPRAIASLLALAPGGETYKQALARTTGKEKQEPVSSRLSGTIVRPAQKFVGDIVRDPAAWITAPMGFGVSKSVVSAAAKGAIQGAVSSTIHGTEREIKGEGYNPAADMLEILTSAGFEAAGTAIPKFFKGAKKYGTEAASELTGIWKETFEKASTPQGRQILKQFVGKQNEIAQEIVERIQNPMPYLKEWPDIERALANMPDVQINKLLVKISALKIKNPVGQAAKRANDTVEGIYNDIFNAMPQTGKGIPAKEFYDMRELIDKNIDWTVPEKSVMNQKLIAIREEMKRALVETANNSGNVEYEGAMRILAEKLDKIDRARKVFGGNAEMNAESVIRNMFNKGRGARRQAIEALTDIYGENYAEMAKMAAMADELFDEGGVVRLYSKFPSERADASFLKGLVPSPLSSPRTFATITLPALKGAEKVSRAAPVMAGAAAPAARTAIAQPKEIDYSIISSYRRRQEEEEKKKQRR